MKLSNAFIGAAFAALAMASTAAQAETFIFTATSAGDQKLWSFDLTGPAGNISYSGGPVQTWPNQADTSISPSSWADFAQTNGVFDGDSITFEGNYPGLEAMAITTTTAFYETGTPFEVPGPHTFDNLTFDVPVGSTRTYDIVGGGELTISAIPEPATWAMLILGVGMIGFAVRRRNEGAALAA